MKTSRRQLEDAIERLIDLLDDVDDDSDFEPDPIEKQHDQEAELTWASDVPPFYVVAECARRKAKA
ncbi:hypothetical protein [Nitratireductor thuwali]|uniref:Uncharacterized protein n=1 Tax=Nitratireductor thuwali TaxID=2267699 RepID=A0ABY5MQR9_9HYPH|nr:hypothetical protein NTH_03983 [Nitratireductor thuwali]